MEKISRNSEQLLEENLLPDSGGKSNFFYSFSFLPRDERMAMKSVYDFCRYTDDLVDEDIALDIPGVDLQRIATIEKKRVRLNWWRAEVERCYEGSLKHPILFSLHKVISRFKIPKQYFLTLIDGVEMDLVKDRYETFDELKEYCYAVASIVGLITIEIFGYKFERTKEYAVDLGIALQLTNILRDVQKDASMGRIYLPKADMRKFGVTEKDILTGNYNLPFINLMKYETARARSYYHDARKKLGKHERFTLFAAQIMDAIYYRLLRKIELREFNVFGKRISVSTPHKILLAFRFWFSSVIFRERGS
ncbi:MAG: presqualene diphosphate synthase HpnD [bacterium]